MQPLAFTFTFCKGKESDRDDRRPEFPWRTHLCDNQHPGLWNRRIFYLPFSCCGGSVWPKHGTDKASQSYRTCRRARGGISGFCSLRN